MNYWILAFLVIFTSLTPTITFILHTASSCVSKNFKILKPNISLESSVIIQSDGLACGEDDFIASEVNEIKFLTVVDGVGSWKHDGVNPKYFVTEFISVLSHKFLAADFKNHDNQNSLQNLVGNSLNFLINARNKAEVNYGSCTIASMTINMKTLHANAYHLGDAAYLIIRDSNVVFSSVDIMKKFNMPYQLGLPNPFSKVDDLSFGKLEKFKLKVNDVIVIGSDGIFDNLFNDHIVDVVYYEFFRKLNKRKVFGYSQAARKISRILTIEAKQIGESSRKIWTPFCVDYKKFYGKEIYGGKNDDTTVVVAIVSYE